MNFQFPFLFCPRQSTRTYLECGIRIRPLTRFFFVFLRAGDERLASRNCFTGLRARFTAGYNVSAADVRRPKIPGSIGDSRRVHRPKIAGCIWTGIPFESVGSIESIATGAIYAVQPVCPRHCLVTIFVIHKRSSADVVQVVGSELFAGDRKWIHRNTKRMG